MLTKTIASMILLGFLKLLALPWILVDLFKRSRWDKESHPKANAEIEKFRLTRHFRPDGWFQRYTVRFQDGYCYTKLVADPKCQDASFEPKEYYQFISKEFYTGLVSDATDAHERAVCKKLGMPMPKKKDQTAALLPLLSSPDPETRKEAEEISRQLEKYYAKCTAQGISPHIPREQISVNDYRDGITKLGCYCEKGEWVLYSVEGKGEFMAKGPFTRSTIVSALARAARIPAQIAPVIMCQEYSASPIPLSELRRLILSGARTISH